MNSIKTIMQEEADAYNNAMINFFSEREMIYVSYTDFLELYQILESQGFNIVEREIQNIFRSTCLALESIQTKQFRLLDKIYNNLSRDEKLLFWDKYYNAINQLYTRDYQEYIYPIDEEIMRIIEQDGCFYLDPYMPTFSIELLIAVKVFMNNRIEYSVNLSFIDSVNESFLESHSQFTDEIISEIERLMQFRDELTFSKISELINEKFCTNFTEKEIWQRVTRTDVPNLKKGRFSKQEDEKLLELYKKYNGDFRKMQKLFDNRTNYELYRRFTILTKKEIIQ